PPGANSPTHHGRSAGTPSRSAAVSTAAPTGPEDSAAQATAGFRYPEWDARRGAYRPDWCTVHETPPRAKRPATPVTVHDRALRGPLARLAPALEYRSRQAHGDDVDIDAAVRARADALAGRPPEELVYLAAQRRRRDLSVLILLDVSGSSGEPGTGGPTVHESQRAAAGALLGTLHDLGDRVALYAYNSHGRAAVHVMPVKHFDERLSASVRYRLGGLTPGAYSRLGAAIRHGGAVLAARGGTTRRLLVVLSDGLAYDHGYERDHGAADVRRALAEARAAGTACVHLSVGAGTGADDLRRAFGGTVHASVSVSRPEQLARVIGPLFRAALRAAEAPRP
ncbi:MAG TPA: VWA domain-containing protein, partial [Rugosimonospora sp.]|nr:VWA domain-containing protein [Rugosimonospora sp.]